MFESIGVLSEKELYARNEGSSGRLHQKGCQHWGAAGTGRPPAWTTLSPVPTEYQSVATDNMLQMHAVLHARRRRKKWPVRMPSSWRSIAEAHRPPIKTNVDAMVEARRMANRLESAKKQPSHTTIRWSRS